MTHHHLNCDTQQSTGPTLNLASRWLISIVIIILGFFLVRPFLIKNLLRRASAYWQYGLFNEVIREHRKAIWLDPHNSYLWNELAITYDFVGDEEKMYQTVRQALVINPRNRIANFLAGRYLVTRNRFAEAVPFFEKVYQLGPDDPEEIKTYFFPYYKMACNILPFCYKKLGEVEKLRQFQASKQKETTF
jgi:tetratricopeptide (TPR) repeat protein